ncbi:EthD domain-containing protein [Hypoxylon sp. FL0890]|nr:EthD domain-containing protein [Hypoxylon sp. FL0890]
MTYTIIALLKRKQGLTPLQFRTHYDTVHLPLLKSLVGSAFPITHTRNYVSRAPTSRTSDHSPDESYPPTVMYQGNSRDVAFDVVTIMTWDTKESWDEFLEIFSSQHVADKIGEDEEAFLDRGRKIIFPSLEPVVATRA